MRRFNQITSVQCWGESERDFKKFSNLIKNGKASLVIAELLTWPKSDLSEVSYANILQIARIGEYIVYDDFNYLLAFGDDSLTLYQEI